MNQKKKISLKPELQSLLENRLLPFMKVSGIPRIGVGFLV